MSTHKGMVLMIVIFFLYSSAGLRGWDARCALASALDRVWASPTRDLCPYAPTTSISEYTLFPTLAILSSCRSKTATYIRSKKVNQNEKQNNKLHSLLASLFRVAFPSLSCVPLLTCRSLLLSYNQRSFVSFRSERHSYVVRE